MNIQNKRNELRIEADVKKLGAVQAFVSEQLEKARCSMKAQLQIAVAVEEIFVNIAKYAYGSEKGEATVQVEISGEPACVTIRFLDQGVPFDPLAKEDPDVTLSAADRRIGGLGIFLVRKTMDEMGYEYRGGQNILWIKKTIGAGARSAEGESTCLKET